MNKMSLKSKKLPNALLLATAVVFIGFPAAAQTAAQDVSPAVAKPAPPTSSTSSSIPQSIKKNVYSKPIQIGDITPSDVSGEAYYKDTETLVTRKVRELNGELLNLQGDVNSLAGSLSGLERENERRAAEYYAAVATINTQLQAGTTPGNPRLMQKLSTAESNLDNLTEMVARLNQVAVDASELASESSFLLESTRSAYTLSGAVEEDHVRLAELEDAISATIVIIERILNNVNDDISRVSGYLSSERQNLRTLSLAVTNGDLYGKSLSNRPFNSAQPFASENGAITPVVATSGLGGPRPLVKIRFDRPDVAYEEPVYMAVNEALERYPNARFDLVAIHPTSGNAAEVAIESTRARRNAERVLRTLTQMGMPLERIDLSYSQSGEAATNEVHIYVR